MLLTLLLLPTLIVRAMLEERTLLRELPGYGASMTQAKYRLIPDVWEEGPIYRVPKAKTEASSTEPPTGSVGAMGRVAAALLKWVAGTLPDR